MAKNIFINYRRDDTGQMSVAIYKELCKTFGQHNIFKDFDAIEPGGDFSKSVNEALKSSHLLLVLIGKDWLSIKDSSGRFRILNEDDYVRLEIASALKNNIKVLSVIIDSAKIPNDADLPFELRELTNRQCVNMYSESFDRDMFHLVHVIKNVIGFKEERLDMEHQFAMGSRRASEIVKPGSNISWSIICIIIGLFIVLADQDEGSFLGLILGLIIIGAGTYSYFSGIQVQKQWIDGNFETARNFSKNARTIAIVTIVGGILLAVILEMLIGISSLAHSLGS